MRWHHSRGERRGSAVERADAGRVVKELKTAMTVAADNGLPGR